ncbi:MAG: ABC transporter permease [Pseudomonadota bacterium]
MKPRDRRAGPGAIILTVFAATVFVFLMLPVLVVFPISVSSAAYLQFPPPGFSWQWYQRYLDDPSWIDATWRSLQAATLCTVLSMTLGVPLTFLLVRSRRRGMWVLDRLAAAPIIVPTIVLSIAIYGVFARLQLIGEWYGVAVAHTVLALPFVVILVGAGLRGFDETQEQAAAGLGASWPVAVWRITLPQLRPSLISAAFLAFISSFDELVVAMFLSGASMTLPKKMFDNIMMEIDPTIAAVSVLQILLVGVCLGLTALFGRGALATTMSR